MSLDVAPVVAHLFDLIGEAPSCASPISFSSSPCKPFS
nr:MAG TPA: hypothetical protein [Caudoviricetes sp.]